MFQFSTGRANQICVQCMWLCVCTAAFFCAETCCSSLVLQCWCQPVGGGLPLALSIGTRSCERVSCVRYVHAVVCVHDDWWVVSLLMIGSAAACDC